MTQSITPPSAIASTKNQLFPKVEQPQLSPKIIPDWLSEVAKVRGEAIAISSIDERPDLSYQALFDQAQTIANQLRELGLKPGDPVVIALENGCDFLVSILSVASAATAFPLNPNQPHTEFARYFSLLEIKAVIVAKGSQSAIINVAKSANILILELSSEPTMAAGQFNLSILHSKAKWEGSKQQNKPQLEDYAVLVGTSGSTGLPKIVSLTHESFFVSINHAADWMQLTSDDRSVVIMPLAFLHALVRSICPLLLRGGQVICTPGYNPSEILSWLDSYCPTFFTAVPSIYRSLLQRIEQTRWVPKTESLRFLVTGSDRITEAEIKAVETVLNVPLIQFYGMSEVSPLPVVRPLPPETTPAGAVGKINPDWEVASVDEKGDLLPPGEEGEIIIRGGYINQLVGITDHRATQSIRNGRFHTGDLGYLDTEGFFYYTGRVDNRINRAGKKVYAGDVEEALLIHPAIKQAVVFGIPDALYGECIGAVVVFNPEMTATPGEIREFMSDQVTAYKIPDHILIEEALPLNPFGKVKRKTLAAHFGLRDLFVQKKRAALQDRTDYVAPRTSTEKALAQIWETLLEVDSVGIHDNFFDLGGHSLLALSLVSQVEAQFRRRLPGDVLVLAPTIAEFAALLALDSDQDDGVWDSLVVLKSGGHKTPLFLVHDADGDTLLYLNLARRLDPERPVYGLRPQGKEGFPILHTRMPTIIDHYLDRIVSVCPQGPYLVGGLCDGGIYAYELAYQLQVRGHQVAFVALLDAIDYEARRLPTAENVREVFGREKLLQYRWLLDRNQTLPDGLQHKIPVRMVLRLAKEGYTPQNFNGKLTLFRATDDAPFETPQRKKIDDPLFGWQQRAKGGLEVYDILGTHSSILREPNVQVLANQIESCIAAALKE